MRKTKIVCTLGPATDEGNVLYELVAKGMNAARLNFSHGTYDDHLRRINEVKRLRTQLDKPVALLLDTRGPEIRIGTLKNGQVQLQDGAVVTITTKAITGDETCLPVNHAKITEDVKPGQKVLIDDGNIELECLSTGLDALTCKIIKGGTVKNSKGVNIPGAKLSLPYLSKKDIEDILFGVEHGVDFIAASFVSCAEDVLAIRKLLDRNLAHNVQIIAKIENMSGVNNIDEILAVSDGIMVARGDMGVEIDFEELPRIQKHIIKRAYWAGKKVITATQMLESMIHNPRPTRAEASDVANAVYDGTSAVMLSGETAVGKYPIESLMAMHRIIETTEKSINYRKRFKAIDADELTGTITDAISHATCTTAHDLNAKAIITVTKSGTTARMISKFRPACDIISCTPDEMVYRQLAMSWGVYPLMAEEKNTTDELFEYAVELAMKAGYIKNGDLTVITMGVPLGVSGSTNTLKVHIVGNLLLTGRGGIVNKSVCGNVCVCANEKEAREKFRKGDIIAIPETSNSMLDILRNASAIITETDSVDSHAEIVAYTLDIPVVVGARKALSVLKDGATVTVDAARGLVYSGDFCKDISAENS